MRGLEKIRKISVTMYIVLPDPSDLDRIDFEFLLALQHTHQPELVSSLHALLPSHDFKMLLVKG